MLPLISESYSLVTSEAPWLTEKDLCGFGPMTNMSQFGLIRYDVGLDALTLCS